MPRRFLHAPADENPELQKQFGCVTGIFQMLDRYHLFKGRRLNGHNHKRFPSGHAILNSSSVGADRSACSPKLVLEKNLSKSSNENQGVSMGSSGISFSSSSHSSFSSLECNRSTQKEPSSMDRTLLERSIRNSAGLKNSNVNSRPIHYESLGDPSPASAQSGCQSQDFRDVVKDSIYRETRSLSVKTSTKEVKNRTLTYRDSPRPMQLSKSADRSYVIGVDGKSRLPADLDDSLRVPAKLKEAPRHFSEASEQPRSSCEAKDTSFFPVSREAPRFSYDGRGISCPLDSRDVSRPVSKLRELPRLSLDSREGSLRSSNFDSKPNSILMDSDSRSINQEVSTASNFQQEWESYKNPIVAKLMGLEPMPHEGLASQKPVNLTETCTSKNNDPFNGQRNKNPIAKAPQATQDGRKDHLLHSPKSSLKDPVSQLKKSDPVVVNSSLPIETAPRRQQERIQIHQQTKLGYREAHLKQQPEAVYSEIEKRLKELQFQKSNKDVRALKQIFHAIQAKGLLETKKGEDQHSKVSVYKKYSGQTPAGNDHNIKSTDTRNLHKTLPFPTLMRGSNTPRAYESPIVIMKPAKSVIESGVFACSAIPLEGLSDLQKLQTSDYMYRNKTSTNNRRVKDQTPKASPGEPTYQPPLSMDKKSTKRAEEISIQKTQVQVQQFSSRRQHSPRENNGSSVQTSGSLSPRIQQRKLETEKRSCPHFPSSSESNKPQRNSAFRQYLELVSPRGRLGLKPAQARQNDDRLSDISSGTRSLSHPGDEISVRSESNISLASQVDIEVTSADRSAAMNHSCLQQGSQSPSRRAANSTSSVIKQKKSSRSLNKDASAVELATVAPEQPSPISVLDASFYQDGMPPPVSKSPNAFKGYEIHPSEHCWNPMPLPENSSPKLSSNFCHKKLENIENLVQKLRQLSSTDDEAPATDHIASPCETRSPDNQYVSEILLASGLLMKDISCGPVGPVPVQLHPSGHPINPDLFLVLEQTRSGSFTKLDSVHENSLRPKPGPEKLHRKLLFDVVNELLIPKLEITSPSAHPYLMLQARKLPARFHGDKDLLRELCSKIEQLKAESSTSDCCNDDGNLILGEDVLRLSEGWNGFSAEVPNVVLEIERSIFKDLINEVVSREGASSLQRKAGRQAAQAIICQVKLV